MYRKSCPPSLGNLIHPSPREHPTQQTSDPPNNPPHHPTTLEISDFNLALTLNSGQVFHAFQLAHDTWQILYNDQLIELKQNNPHLQILKGEPTLVAHYLALDHPIHEFHKTFPSHPYCQEAITFCKGLRIMRQPHWECLATFLLSPLKQVAHIRQMSLALRKNFGQPIPGSLTPAFPTPEAIAPLHENDLRKCGLGFRAKNLLSSARIIADGQISLENIRTLPTDALRHTLCKLPGIGRKVANCIALFAYERLEVIPVDVWIARITSKMRKRKAPPIRLEKYAARRFGPYAGYLQQYLFHFARTTGKIPNR